MPQLGGEKTHFDLTRRLGVATAAVFEWETQHQLTPGTHFREREIKSQRVREEGGTREGGALNLKTGDAGDEEEVGACFHATLSLGG